MAIVLVAGICIMIWAITIGHKKAVQTPELNTVTPKQTKAFPLPFPPTKSNLPEVPVASAFAIGIPYQVYEVRTSHSPDVIAVARIQTPDGKTFLTTHPAVCAMKPGEYFVCQNILRPSGEVLHVGFLLLQPDEIDFTKTDYTASGVAGHFDLNP
jgi:hypothetical protein